MMTLLLPAAITDVELGSTTRNAPTLLPLLHAFTMSSSVVLASMDVWFTCPLDNGMVLWSSEMSSSMKIVYEAVRIL
jgi:hypothetical protein